MKDKGKAALSARELAEQEREARIRERVAQWVQCLENEPPTCSPKHPKPQSSGPFQAGPSHVNLGNPDSPKVTPVLPNFPNSPEYTPASPQQNPSIEPDSPEYTPARLMPEPHVVTDLVPEEVLLGYWERSARSNPSDLELWHRFEDGFVPFRYGTTWAEIDRLEREAAWDRRYARLRGEEASEIPPPIRPREILLRIRVEPEAPPVEEYIPQPINVENEPMEISDEEDSSQDEVDDEEDEEEDDWSDTSTITVEPTMVPPAYRRPIWARRVGARRT